MKIRISSILYALLFLGVIAADRLSKMAILNNLTDRYALTSWLSFDLVLNRGMSWGMFHAASPWVFVLITFVIMSVTSGVLLYAYNRYKQGQLIVGEIMVIAGALSNIIDRFLYRGVIDFILISYGEWQFPLFNIADVAIVLGVFIMIITSYKESWT